MAQLAKAFAALQVDIGLNPSAHVGWLTAAYNSNSNRPGSLFWPPVHLHTCEYTFTLTHTLKQK